MSVAPSTASWLAGLASREGPLEVRPKGLGCVGAAGRGCPMGVVPGGGVGSACVRDRVSVVGGYHRGSWACSPRPKPCASSAGAVYRAGCCVQGQVCCWWVGCCSQGPPEAGQQLREAAEGQGAGKEGGWACA